MSNAIDNGEGFGSNAFGVAYRVTYLDLRDGSEYVRISRDRAKGESMYAYERRLRERPGFDWPNKLIDIDEA